MLQALITTHQEALLADWRARLHPLGADDAGAADTRAEMTALLAALGPALADDSAAAQAQLDAVLRNASQVRAASGQAPEQSVLFVQAGKDALLALLARHGPPGAGVRDAAVLRLITLTDHCVLTLVSQHVATREGVIRSQAQSLLDMATPVIMLWDSILLLPLVGIVDSVRAVQIAESLLESIGRTEAEITLIDVTGVPVMDTSVARHLLRTVAAARMLGTQVILTGISPTTAQTMVKLGIDLSSVPTRGSLKAGVALAMSLTGRQVRGRDQA